MRPEFWFILTTVVSRFDKHPDWGSGAIWNLPEALPVRTELVL